ncbi:hypothetical protein EW145_g230 [Phellinidium pouzarii]|uniref:Uncharacterized protein n=1 Tax=Phellinidium pouzarii TaxID=167371 RepID=A0A4S4LPR8_9AGAM|nr:hypothetical protein EW145_g230 [Phellinidium pouzarii]
MQTSTITVDSPEIEEPEDILSTSLGILYNYAAISFTVAGSTFTYTYAGDTASHTNVVGGEAGRTVDLKTSPRSITLRLHTPDTLPRNWGLHVSSVWASSLVLADHISCLGLEALVRSRWCSLSESAFDVLELGAGAGLPGLLIAKCLERISTSKSTTSVPNSSDQRNPLWRVTLSDYPDDLLIENLRANVRENGFMINELCTSGASNSTHDSNSQGRVRVVPYAWGDDIPPALLSSGSPSKDEGYDLIIAADTLWNAGLHEAFLYTLQRLLRRAPHARVHLVAGLHTGRLTLRMFLNLVHFKSELNVLEVEEWEVSGERAKRAWEERLDEDTAERRRWIVWIVLGWNRGVID